MSTKQPSLITEENISLAWAKAFMDVYERGKSHIHPMCISVTGFSDNVITEDEAIRVAVDKSLNSHGDKKCSVAVSAATIFPVRGTYGFDAKSRDKIYAWYIEKLLPRLKKRDSRNVYGTYFERMISFEGTAHGSNGSEIKTINQLEHIIHDWTRPRDKAKRPRQSALQVSCFDPTKDHTGQSVRGFPCLQQVSFGYDDSGGLSISAYYPTQYIYDRGYGNYLGLCQLGVFMARALGLSLRRFNCFIAHPELGGTTKSEVADLEESIRAHLQEDEGCSENVHGGKE